MNDLVRPMLYDSFHFIWPTKPDAGNIPKERRKDLMPANAQIVDVVGPICRERRFSG